MVDEKGLDEASADKIGEFVRMNGGEELIEELLKSKLAESATAKQGLEDMRLLLRWNFFVKLQVLGLTLGFDFTFTFDNNDNDNHNDNHNDNNDNPHLNLYKGTVLGVKDQGLGRKDKG